ncbi:unnamed protein product [Pedinophyceae sp. YPF-701]|nr:unnamed protein product [Pedinophyceae sp. YPF-701]
MMRASVAGRSAAPAARRPMARQALVGRTGDAVQLAGHVHPAPPAELAGGAPQRQVAAQEVASLAAKADKAVAVQPAEATGPLAQLAAAPPAYIAGGVGLVALLAVGLQKAFSRGSRTYDGNVGDEYDAWTEEGILEYYWGEHIHLGYYNEEERKRGYLKKDFKVAKKDFVDEMLRFAGCAKEPKTILDVGCGIGGTTRILAKKFPNAKCVGITLSPNQVQRATELAKEQGLTNVEFRVMNALEMEFEPNQFDLVWGCESGEHMPDKKAYVDEMARVLAPGGSLVIACWCQREEGDRPFTQAEKDELQFLYDEWAHPFFISKELFAKYCADTGLSQIVDEDWCRETIDSWRHSIWVGVFDPWIVIWKGLTRGPWIWWKVIREIVTLERMHRAFDKGLMEYGMIRATKAA